MCIVIIDYNNIRKREFYFHLSIHMNFFKKFLVFFLSSKLYLINCFLFILSCMLVYGFSEKKYKRCGCTRLHEHAVLFNPLFNEITLRSFFVCSTVTKKQQRIANFALCRKKRIMIERNFSSIVCCSSDNQYSLVAVYYIKTLNQSKMN